MYPLNVFLFSLSISCGRPFNNRLNHGVESVDKGDRIPHPGKEPANSRHETSYLADLKNLIQGECFRPNMRKKSRSNVVMYYAKAGSANLNEVNDIKGNASGISF